MKKSSFLIFAVIILFSCSPVLRQDSIDRATFNYRSSEIKQNPASYRGNLFVFGGIIVSTTAVERGSLIEALYAPVDSRGYLKNVQDTGDRYLAIYPKDYGFLDPMIFRKGREITIAGEFIGLQTGKIDEMDYIFPLFQIEEVHLWQETSDKDSYTSDSFHAPLVSDDLKIHILYQSSGNLQGVDNRSHQGVQNESSESRDGIKSDGVKAAEPSETQEAASKNGMLGDRNKTADQNQLLTKSEGQDFDRKESPVAAVNFIEKPEIQKFPDSQKQATTEEKALELPIEEKVIDGKKSIIQTKKSFDGLYYVQVGAWKHSDLAEKMFNRLRGKYHQAHIFVENDLYKVRISGVRTIEEGIKISQDIRKKFNIKPIVVRNRQ